MRLVGMALALGLLLAGCGGSGGAPKASKSPATKATAAVTKATATAKPTVVAPTGVAAPQDLHDFQCFPDAAGVWNSSGILKNNSKKSVTYQVTVFVGQANGADAKASTKQFVVNATGSAQVAMAKLPAPKQAAQCYVQVLAK